MKRWKLMVGLVALLISLPSCGGCDDDTQVDKLIGEAMKAGAEEEAAKEATLNLPASDSGTVDESQKTYNAGESFYSYKDFAYGYISFSQKELLDFFALPDVTIISAELQLTKHEYHSASGAELYLSASAEAFAKDQANKNFNELMQSYAAIPDTAKTKVACAPENEAKDTFDVTALLQKAIDEKWFENANAGLVIYLALVAADTEHSGEWFGAQSETPPQLVIQYTTK